MRATLFPKFIACAAGVVCAGCVSSGEPASVADAMVERGPHGGLFAPAPATRDADVDGDGDADDDTSDYPPWDTNAPDPGGWCHSRGARARCVKGGTCTFTGHCTPAGTPPPDAGAEPCGLVACDREWCTCISATESTCDCTP